MPFYRDCPNHRVLTLKRNCVGLLIITPKILPLLAAAGFRKSKILSKFETLFVIGDGNNASANHSEIFHDDSIPERDCA
jgi:hypothetical protein